MTIHAPQLIWICLAALRLGIAIAKQGQPRPAEVYHPGVTLIAIVLVASLLWWGGFFGGAS